MEHRVDDLIQIFKDCFEDTYQTRLVRGDIEPLYRPAQPGQDLHEIVFAHGFFSSALHEISHWLIAGPQRRLLEDFGYWYEPDGRTAAQQALFEQVEIKPQATEWILSDAAGYRFQVSTDNLNGEFKDNTEFKHSVYQQVCHYCEEGLPMRTEIFRNALAAFYDTPRDLCRERFRLADLR
ncbi:elongation factor P hydroxylase [Nitrincola alkalisediminis]|uniref:Elongation factor P hydroxylase n=2 Tax=Nitrincola nitratireducens TaxID=1229521 RepID=W9V152_9GAMM|nr:elongation factor P hydroxylase [Nitrincola alkalisediminis]EXJ09837.1 hypothetical protein D791_03165 [Nitrincola nitratireducens]